MLQVLLLSSAALASAEGACVPRPPLSIDAAKLRIAAHRLFVVNGSADTMAYSDMPSVDTIDRQLTVAFDLPELNVTADGSSPFKRHVAALGAAAAYDTRCALAWSSRRR